MALLQFYRQKKLKGTEWLNLLRLGAHITSLTLESNYIHTLYKQVIIKID